MSQDRLIAMSRRTNRVYFLDRTAVAGGQSALYDVDGDTTLVALVPVESENRGEYFRKAGALIKKGTRNRNFAFPLELLYCPKDPNKPVAILLERLPGSPLEDLLFPVEREELGLHWDEHEFRIVARELTKLFAFSEHQGFCQNDTHPGQYLVEWGADGTPTRVSRVDLLAASFWHDNVYYGSEKTHWEYVAPELQHLRRRVGLKGFHIPREADRFGLASLLFALLAGGKHTDYAGGEAEPEKRVERKEFAVISMPKDARVPDAVEEAYYRLPPEVRVLFERAFLGDPKNRPSPVEWLSALKKWPQSADNSAPWTLPLPSLTAPLGSVWRRVKAWAGAQSVGLIGAVALVAAVCLVPRGGPEPFPPPPAQPPATPPVAAAANAHDIEAIPEHVSPELLPPRRRAKNPDAVTLLNKR